ncbi:hypothetical protein QFC20_001714 [Naganishia adeliensis]|uniref:Uncharacterized protein n=1 Tax=Naganishia adeliensis TaxID=92952 RepID=A0ACC2WRX0_9TREE|nr:hypothetical protein QFC20_001714 [Naganishia adeliensis]
MSISKSSIKALVPLSDFEDSPPRLKGRKVSTGTFGHGQRGSLLVPFVDVDGGLGDVTTPVEVIEDQPEAERDQLVAESAVTGPPSPSSFYTAVMSVASLPVNPTDDSLTTNDPETPVPPETPQTSTSLASYLSDASTLGPLATQQDIRDDPSRFEERKQNQRKKLEKMLGGEVDDDGTSGTDVEAGPSDTEERQSEDSSTTPLLPSVSAFGNPTSRTHSTTDVRLPVMPEPTSKLALRTGSFGNVLESGKKTLARLNQGSVLRGKRSTSPGEVELDEGLDLGAEERKVLWNRTRKLGRVLGETLNEREVGELVVGRSRNGSPVVGAEGRFERQEEQEMRDSSDDTPLNVSIEDGSVTLDVSSPLSPTLKRIRRYSDPTSPGILSPLDESLETNIEVDDRRLAKQQRRMRLDKLNRLLGAHVPLELLGPAVYPVSERDEVVEDEEEQKKRAVKVASKMFSMFGEPPPVNPCLPVPLGETTSGSYPANGYRSRLKTSVALYHQTINSIRYLIEHDRRLLHSVMDELDSKPDAPTLTHDVALSSNVRRKRSLSSPTAPISPLPTANEDLDAHEPLASLRRRAIKLNSFFGDPRTAASHIRGGQSRVYEATDRKAAALERLLSDLEEDVGDGELGADELVQIRESISDTRRVVSMHGDL